MVFVELHKPERGQEPLPSIERWKAILYPLVAFLYVPAQALRRADVDFASDGRVFHHLVRGGVSNEPTEPPDSE